MTDLEVALALEKSLLVGEPFSYPCGCFGVVTEVHKWNANWVRPSRHAPLCADTVPARRQRPGHYAPEGYSINWRTRDGGFILEREILEHVAMSERVYGKAFKGA